MYSAKNHKKLAGSKRSYCKNYQAYFFGPPCKWNYSKTSNKRPRRLLEHWPRLESPPVSPYTVRPFLRVYVNFTLRVNSQRLYLLV